MSNLIRTHLNSVAALGVWLTAIFIAPSHARANFDSCEPNPCLNGGVCEQNDDNSITCICAPQFTGLFCEMLAPDPCLPNPCLNGGQCIGQGDQTFVCECPPGFTGNRCEVPVPPDPCDPNPCMNGGACEDEGDSYFSCECAPGWEGDRCETSVCAGIPAWSNATQYWQGDQVVYNGEIWQVIHTNADPGWPEPDHPVLWNVWQAVGNCS